MIRPFTLVCMVSAFAAGLYLYQSKHHAQVLDREIGRTIKQTEAAHERIGMLRAEWAVLNEPDRLAELAKAHTMLQTLKPNQFVPANELAAHLPAPGQMALAEPEPPVETTVVSATPAPVKPAAVASAAPETKPVADVKPAMPARHVVARPTAVARVEPPATEAGVHNLSPPQAVHTAPVVANNDPTAPGTVGAAVLRAMRSQNDTPSTYMQAIAVPSYAAPVTSSFVASPYVASRAASSLLGSSRGALPPPVPFAAR